MVLYGVLQSTRQPTRLLMGLGFIIIEGRILRLLTRSTRLGMTVWRWRHSIEYSVRRRTFETKLEVKGATDYLLPLAPFSSYPFFILLLDCTAYTLSFF